MTHPPNATRNCFVLMPFTVRPSDLPRYNQDSKHWSQVYEGLVLTAVRSAGLNCERDDIDIGSRLMADNILMKIERADVILCDLSSHNPNVFLELGWALRADKPYVLIQDDQTTFTFDLNQQYTFKYSSGLQPIELKTEAAQLSDVVKSTVNDRDQRYSILRRMSLSMKALESAHSGNIETELLLEIRQAIGQLKAPRKHSFHLFPWPELLSRANELLRTVSQFIEGRDVTQRALLRNQLDQLSIDNGAAKQEDIQFTVVDEQGDVIYHDWPSMIGTLISCDPNLWASAGLRSGAFAWTDTTSNIADRITYGVIRQNIAIFGQLPTSQWTVIVEVHYELG